MSTRRANIATEVNALKAMTVKEMRGKYAEVFGEPTRCRHKDYLIRRIAWRLQALEQGGLSERARRRAEELANDADLRIFAPKKPLAINMPPTGHITNAQISVSHDSRLPMPGTLLTREYKGQTIQVMVLDNGFEYEGQVYRSLSRIAKVVSGSHWNGYGFFGLKKGK